MEFSGGQVARPHTIRGITMRTMRTVTAAGAAALLALTSVIAVAASDADPCTGTVEFDDAGMAWSATDPRLTGEAVVNGGWSLYPTPAEDAGEPTGEDQSYIIVNEDGTWGCAKSEPAGPEPDATGHTLIFAGTGDYEGLTAHVRIDWSTYPFGFSGVIVEDSVPEEPTLQG
jgi:hypothetical protein